MRYFVDRVNSQRCLAASLVLFAVLPLPGFAQQISSDIAKRASEAMSGAVKAGRLAGGVHLASINGKPSYAAQAGWRDIEDGSPFQPDTVVRIYSMSKPITSVTAMTLYEQGKFQLDDPVSKFIPSFAKTTVMVVQGDSFKIVPANRPITVRDVFRHTTGFSYGNGNPFIRKFYAEQGMLYRPPAGMFPPDMTIAEAAEALAKIPALHHPGERFTYGFNTDLLGRLIEIWSGKPLDEYMKAAVLDPLGMADTGFRVRELQRERFASCHTTRDGKLVVLDKWSSSPYNTGFKFLSGGGGLVSTANDYGRFCQMLVNGGTLAGKRVLKKETLKLMFTNQLQDVPGDFQFGLGFAISNVTLGSGKEARQARQYAWGGYASTNFGVVPDAKMYQVFLRQHIPSRHGLGVGQMRLIYSGVLRP